MTSKIANPSPYLKTSRGFTEDLHELAVDVNKAYIDIASIVNGRTIGLYPVNRPAITGNDYFYSTRKQQSLRQLYSFTSTATIPIGFKLSTISNVIQMYGTYMDSTGNSYGLVAGTSVAVAGLITFYIKIDATPGSLSDLLTFVVGAGSPDLVSGSIVLEWIADI